MQDDVVPPSIADTINSNTIDTGTIDSVTIDSVHTKNFALHYLYTIYLFIVGNSVDTLENILLVALVYIVVCLSLYNLVFRQRLSYSSHLCNNVRFPNCRRVLIVTAHPDDEAMFFGPTILSLANRPNCTIYLLCLSNGDYDRQGVTRQKELWKSCKLLNIHEENITIIRATNLPDDPTVNWKSQLIAKQMLKQVESLDIDAIITFDRDGVSQHANHCAIYYATASICISGLIPDGCKIFTLSSVNTCRKYMFLFDLLPSLLFSSNWCILNWRDFKLVQEAMAQHKSQMVWFRRLYIRFSRYMIINTLREMNLSDVELEIQIADSKDA